MTTIRRKNPKVEELEADISLKVFRACSTQLRRAKDSGGDAVTLAELREEKTRAKFRYMDSFYLHRRCWSITAQRWDPIRNGASKNVVTLKDGGILTFLEAQDHALKMAAEFESPSEDPFFLIHIASLHAGEAVVTLKNWNPTGWRKYSVPEARVCFMEKRLTKERGALLALRKRYQKEEETLDRRVYSIQVALDQASSDFFEELETQKAKEVTSHMTVWWVSWYFPLKHRGSLEIASKWPEGLKGWLSGESDVDQIWCARVEASSEEEVWIIVHMMYGSLASHVRERFIDEKEEGWWPEPTRFPR